MVKTKRELVFGSCLLSALAVVLTSFSLGSEQWVTAQGRITVGGENHDEPSIIKYGLFSGIFYRKSGILKNFEIKMTCLMEENVCAYLCQATKEGREKELRDLYAGLNPEFDQSCPGVRRTNDLPIVLKDDRIVTPEGRIFLNAGLLISTVVFMGISLLFGAISTILAFWNTVSNPYEVFLSIYGIYIYNSIACVGNIMALILWGALFGSSIIENVGILYTIRGQMDTYGMAFLGYSYWLNIASFILYLTSIGVLYIRQYLISQEPEIKIHTASGETDVGAIMIY